MRSLVALEGMREVVFVVHVAMSAKVVVEAHLAFPTHSHDAMLLAAVANDVRVADTYGTSEQYALEIRDTSTGKPLSLTHARR